ncbi:hypothetical protein QBC39DRAFT_435635 [Podospora conica]|nr:hypothetical protein QBC39DRAFT_435635 [Schizothecium conicum]
MTSHVHLHGAHLGELDGNTDDGTGKVQAVPEHRPHSEPPFAERWKTCPLLSTTIVVFHASVFWLLPPYRTRGRPPAARNVDCLLLHCVLLADLAETTSRSGLLQPFNALLLINQLNHQPRIHLNKRRVEPPDNVASASSRADGSRHPSTPPLPWSKGAGRVKTVEQPVKSNGPNTPCSAFKVDHTAEGSSYCTGLVGLGGSDLWCLTKSCDKKHSGPGVGVEVRPRSPRCPSDVRRVDGAIFSASPAENSAESASDHSESLTALPGLSGGGAPPSAESSTDSGTIHLDHKKSTAGSNIYHGFWSNVHYSLLCAEPDKLRHPEYIAAGAHRENIPFVISQETYPTISQQLESLGGGVNSASKIIPASNQIATRRDISWESKVGWGLSGHFGDCLGFAMALGLLIERVGSEYLVGCRSWQRKPRILHRDLSTVEKHNGPASRKTRDAKTDDAH